jgi:riboflavin synthase alpha subunit
VVECGTAALGGAHRQAFPTAEGGGATRQLSVTLIPTTLRETTLGGLAAGDRVNLETDLLAKYVRRALGMAGATASDERLSEALRRAGFID